MSKLISRAMHAADLHLPLMYLLADSSVLFAGMVNQVRHLSSKHSQGGVRFDCHKEVFEL